MRTRPFTISDALPALAAVSAVCAFLGTLGGVAVVPAALGAWLWLMLAPGLVLALLCREDDPFRALLAAVVLSPLIFAAVAALAMIAGSTPITAAAVTAGATLAGALVAWRLGRPSTSGRGPTHWLALSLLVGATVLAVCYLPMAHEWWRLRSDAWFHAAVVAQIRDYGLPPEDPYFAGIPLQYMWLYHVVVLVLSQATTLDPFRVMALINVQGLAGLCLAGWALAGVFRNGTRDRVCATLSLLFAFNAAFWIFLPVKAVRALTGDVRGAAELARTFSLHPFTYDTVCGLSNIYYNQEFFLDKFMVATAFGFALTYMTAAWYGALDHLATRRSSSLAVLAVSMLGMLGFHSLVGFVMIAGLCGGAVLVLLLRSRVDALRVRGLVVVGAVPLACLLLASPYLYELMRMKESDQIFPLSLSLQKTVGIAISCALAAFLVLRYRVLFQDRSPSARLLLLGALATTVFCLVIRLPGSNTFDKLGYFVFIPISIPAGFAVADTIAARRGRARVRVAAAWVVLFLLPLNGLALAASYHTPGETVVSAPEQRLSQWVRENTSRDALFIDHNDHVFLLVTGPRRYYWGRWAYASQWGYSRPRMALRWHTMLSLYQSSAPDAAALESLGAVKEPLYAVVRPGDRAAGAAVLEYPELFQPLYDDGDIALYRIDTAACRAAAATAPAAPSPEEMLRASGL